VVTDRQAEARPLARGLGREERLEQFVLNFRWDARAVVGTPDLARIAKTAVRGVQGWPVRGVPILPGALGRRVKAITEQIEEHPGDLLRRQFDPLNCRVEFPL